MDDGIHEFGTNACGQVVDAGRYVVGPSSQLVFLQSHVPLKPGFRLATADELIAAGHANGERAVLEQIAADKAIAEARAAADAAVEAERPLREFNAARAAAKAEARQKTERVIAPAVVGEQPAEVAGDAQPVEPDAGDEPVTADGDAGELAQGEHHDDGDRGEQPQDAAAQPAATGESVDGS